MDNAFVKGKYRFKKFDPHTGALKWTGPWVKNLVMIGPNRGLGLITARMAGETANDVDIDNASIGKGFAAPQITDVDLEDPILEDIPRASQSHTEDSVLLGFFIPSADLPNDEYTEFAVFSGDQIFARSLIDPAFIKSSNEDVGIEYSFLLGNFVPEGS